MGRETSPYIVGDFWLDKRRDGKSPDVWQIAWYDETARSLRYSSTRKRGLDDAKRVLDAHHVRARTEGPQRAEEATVVPLLLLYWEERGRNAIKPAQIASSLRQFIAFLAQDRAGLAVTVSELNPNLFERFRQWRMAPHSYNLRWEKRDYAHSSKGVRGESVQRNLDDIRAALNHHADNGRIPYSPKVPAIKREMRSPPRERVLSYDELGAMIGYARSDPPFLRYILLMLATLARPEAALKFDPARQYDASHELIDLHHPDAPRTKKRNPVVPAIEPFRSYLKEWREQPTVQSMKTRWRTMRRCLGLGSDVIGKTIRHTVATRLRALGINHLDLSALLGHTGMSRTTAVYAKYDPSFMAEASKALSIVWAESWLAADKWAADHLRTKEGNRQTIILDTRLENTRISKL